MSIPRRVHRWLTLALLMRLASAQEAASADAESRLSGEEEADNPGQALCNRGQRTTAAHPPGEEQPGNDWVLALGSPSPTEQPTR